MVIKTKDKTSTVYDLSPKLTPEVMAEGWANIVNTAVSRHGLTGNDLRIVMDDALTKAGIVWDVEYNVGKLDKFDVSWMDDTTYSALVKAFIRAVHVIVDVSSGYTAGPYYSNRANDRRLKVTKQNDIKNKAKCGAVKPKLRRSWSKRLKVKK